MTAQDRKSTRLNSSHSQISYAVFCLKKKNKPDRLKDRTQVAQPGQTRVLVPLGADRTDPDWIAHQALGPRVVLVAARPIEAKLIGQRNLVLEVTIEVTPPLGIEQLWMTRPSFELVNYRLRHQMEVAYLFFFFNHPAPPDFYPFPPHDALPI